MEEQEQVATEAYVHPKKHPHAVNVQTQVVVVGIAVVIFVSGVIFGSEWVALTRDMVASPAVVVNIPQNIQVETPVSEESAPAKGTERESVEPAEKLLEGVVHGFYTRYEIDVFEDQVVCHAFTITGGNRDIVDKYTELIDEGNSVQRRDTEGRLMINLPWDTMTVAERDEVRASSEATPLSIVVKENRPSFVGASACFSFLTYIKSE